MAQKTRSMPTSHGALRRGQLFLFIGLLLFIGAFLLPSIGLGPAVLLGLLGVGVGFLGLTRLRTLKLKRALDQSDLALPHPN